MCAGCVDQGMTESTGMNYHERSTALGLDVETSSRSTYSGLVASTSYSQSNSSRDSYSK